MQQHATLLGPQRGSMPVVVLGVLVEDAVEVLWPEGQEVVGACAAEGAVDPFADRVGFRGSERAGDDADVCGGEDVAEQVRCEHLAAVADQELAGGDHVVEFDEQGSGGVGGEPGGGWWVTATWGISRVAWWMTTSTCRRRRPMVGTVKTSHETMPAAGWCKNSAQVGSLFPGAGEMPFRWRRVVLLLWRPAMTPPLDVDPGRRRPRL
ncbi:MAG: hypothetical protein HYX32_07130 [Actinobacteria bacterium]|nr:hypothetical protein [Actinomycetota bacterium]